MNRATTMRRLGADVPMMKERLSKAFAAMRRRDILARQKLQCCQTCALNQIQTMLEERATRKDPERRKVYDGYAFYHTQDAEALDHMFEWYKRLDNHFPRAEFPRPIDSRKLAAQTDLNLTHCWNSTLLYIGYGTTLERTARGVGRIIVECLRDSGIEAEWNGNPNTRIRVPLMQDHMTKPKGAAK